MNKIVKELLQEVGKAVVIYGTKAVAEYAKEKLDDKNNQKGNNNDAK